MKRSKTVELEATVAELRDVFFDSLAKKEGMTISAVEITERGTIIIRGTDGVNDNPRFIDIQNSTDVIQTVLGQEKKRRMQNKGITTFMRTLLSTHEQWPLEKLSETCKAHGFVMPPSSIKQMVRTLIGATEIHTDVFQVLPEGQKGIYQTTT